MKKRAADVLKFVVFLGIGIFFIYWFLLKLDDEQKQAIWQSFIGANYGWVAAAMLCCLLSHFVRALRWQLLYKPLQLRPTLNNTFGSVVVAYLANLAFPRLGEVARCATMATSEGIPLEKSIGTVVTERIFDVLLFGVVVLLGLLFMSKDITSWLYDGLLSKFASLHNVSAWLVGIIVVLCLGAYPFYRYVWKRLLRFGFFKKIDDLARGCIDGVVSIFHLGRRNTWLFLAYSIGIYLLYILGGLIIMQAFDETAGMSLKVAFAVYLFGSVGMTISQGGLGVYPVLVQIALGLFGVAMEVGTAAGWLLWSSQQVAVIVVGAAYLIYFSLIKRRSASITPEQEQKQ